MSKNKFSKDDEDCESSIIRIPPNHYIHILDTTSNITHLFIGPKTHIRQENERLVTGPNCMISLTPFDYCVITNPCVKDTLGAVVIEHGQVKLKYGEEEYRFYQEPFPLYPGEILSIKTTKLKVVPPNVAIILSAKVDFEDENGIKHVAGDEWLFEGPATYYPRREVVIKCERNAHSIKKGDAIRLRALKDCKDRTGVERIFGEEWLVKKEGAYQPGPYEEFVEYVNAIPLNEQTALLLEAVRTHVDCYNKRRKHGECWLVTYKDTESHILDVNEKLKQTVTAITLTSRQYAVKLNPVDAQGVCQLGKKKLVRGECSFFLNPGEELESGVEDVYVLSENEGLVLKANETVTIDSTTYKPGERWMIRGPTEYVPPVSVEVICRRMAIPLDENEGIYVRDTKTGRVRAVTGESYMLNQDEELWEKQLTSVVESLLTSGLDPLSDRNSFNKSACTKTVSRFQPEVQQVSGEGIDRTRVINFRVPHNSAVQVYDYKLKKARVVFGPDRVMLGPDEQFTVLSLSGGKPKRPNQIKGLCLLLGPDFCTDIITVETADHARLSMQLSYNWHFDLSNVLPKGANGDVNMEAAAALFSVPDFVGDMCKAIASRVRGTVASVQFDDFHKNSARIIRSSVFGLDESGKVRSYFLFPANNLKVTSIDVQSVEPVDQKTRDSLQKSVQLAIEITTNSQEASAKHEAERLEQQARGRLERQRIEDQAAAERSRRQLLELQVELAALQSTGQAKAEATSRAEAQHIEGAAAVEQAKLQAEAAAIEAESELTRLKEAREAELKYLEQKNIIDLKRRNQECELEVARFSRMVEAVGAETLRAMATAGPEQEIKLLQSLGLQSTLITDGSTPVNLLTTAHGLIGKTMGMGDFSGHRAGDKRTSDIGHPTLSGAITHPSVEKRHTRLDAGSPVDSDGDDA